MDADRLIHAKHVLSGLQWQLLGDSESGLVREGELERVWFCVDHTEADAVAALLRDFTDAANYDVDTPVRKCWVASPQITPHRQLEGNWRNGGVRIDRYNGDTGQRDPKGTKWAVVQVLKLNLLTALNYADARLVESQVTPGDGATNSTSERYLTFEWVGVNPDSVQALTAAKAGTEVVSDLAHRKIEHNGSEVTVSITGDWHPLAATALMEPDGSATVRWLVADPEYVLTGFSSWLGSRQTETTYYYNVPEALAQGIIDAAKARGADAGPAGYNDQKGLVNIRVSQVDLTGVNLSDVTISEDCDQVTTADFAWGGADAATNGINVTGAGTSAANGEYAPIGTLNGKVWFRRGATSYYVRWQSSSWVIYFDTVPQVIYYSSTEDVPTPDLVNTWTAVSGTAPLPDIVPLLPLPIPDSIPAGTSYDRNVSENGDGGFSVVRRKRVRKYRNLTEYSSQLGALITETVKEWRGVTDEDLSSDLAAQANKLVDIQNLFNEDCSMTVRRRVQTPVATDSDWFSVGSGREGTLKARVATGQTLAGAKTIADSAPDTGTWFTRGNMGQPDQFGLYSVVCFASPAPASYSSSTPFKSYSQSQSIPDIVETAVIAGVPHKRSRGNAVFKVAGNTSESTVLSYLSDCNYELDFQPQAGGRYFQGKGIKTDAPGEWSADDAGL